MEYITITEYRDEKIDRTISKSLNDYVDSSIKKLKDELIANEFSIKCKRINSNLYHSIGVWGVWGVYGDLNYKIKNSKIYYVQISWRVSHQMKLYVFTQYKKFDTYINSLERERVLKIEELEIL
jgi:hypothetical protein